MKPNAQSISNGANKDALWKINVKKVDTSSPVLTSWLSENRKNPVRRFSVWPK